MKLIYLIIAGLLLAPLSAMAAPASSISTPIDYDEQMPGLFRIGLIGGYGLMTGDTSYGNGDKDQARPSGYSVGLVGGFGRGMFSGEAGVMLMNIPSIVKLEDVQNDALVIRKELVNAEYVGIPLWAKYNYIEKPLATFFIKAGAIPIFLLSQSKDAVLLEDGSKQNMKFATMETLAVAGIGGTSALGKNTAFILDLSGFYSMTEAIEGVRNQGAMASIGLSFDL